MLRQTHHIRVRRWPALDGNLPHFSMTYLSRSGSKDYCPNGLQVEGRDHINHLVTGVTASQALIETAIERGADAILASRLFLAVRRPCIVGIKAKRIRSLIAHDVSLRLPFASGLACGAR